MAEEADEAMTITVQASGFSFRPYLIMVEPTEDLPVGGPGSLYNVASYKTKHMHDLNTCNKKSWTISNCYKT